MDERCLTKTHQNKEDGSIRYAEHYYYVPEAKLVVKDNILISISTEFVENSGMEETKQDCELKVCCHLMEKLKTCSLCIYYGFKRNRKESNELGKR